MWHGYAIYDMNLVLTEKQKDDANVAVRGMGKQSDSQPARITHTRQSLDETQVLAELVLDDEIGKTDIVGQVAAALGLDTSLLDSLSTLTVFAGSTWDERRLACADYLVTNIAEWET